MEKIKVVRTPRPERLPFWKRFVFWELVQGLSVTLMETFHSFRAPFTVEYPEHQIPLQPRFRGYPRLRRHPDTGDELCMACLQCEKACPDQCIKIETEPHPSGRGRRAKTFEIDYERCCLCGLCAEACNTQPYSAIYMSHDYEYAQYDRTDFTANMRQLYEGCEKVPYGRKK